MQQSDYDESTFNQSVLETRRHNSDLEVDLEVELPDEEQEEELA